MSPICSVSTFSPVLPPDCCLIWGSVGTIGLRLGCRAMTLTSVVEIIIIVVIYLAVRMFRKRAHQELLQLAYGTKFGTKCHQF